MFEEVKTNLVQGIGVKLKTEQKKGVGRKVAKLDGLFLRLTHLAFVVNTRGFVLLKRQLMDMSGSPV